MLVSVADDKIVCSRCRDVMSSIAEIAKHKCCSNTPEKRQSVMPNSSTPVAGRRSDVSTRLNDAQTVVKSPMLRSSAKRSHDTRARSLASVSAAQQKVPQTQPIDLGPELVEITQADPNDSFNVDILGD